MSYHINGKPIDEYIYDIQKREFDTGLFIGICIGAIVGLLVAIMIYYLSNGTQV